VTLPSVEELLAGSHVVRLPMRVRFRGLDVREVMLLEGPAGWGEFAPFGEYEDDEASFWLASAVESAWQGWPETLRQSVSVNATVPAVPPRDVAAVLERFPGCRTAKVKVAETGQFLADDVARVAEVRALLGRTGRVRVDANGAWDVEEAVRALTALSRYDLEYAEQPCARVEDLARVRNRLAAGGCDVRVAADESIRRAGDPFRVAAAGAADVAVVKVPPLGGVRRTLAVAHVLREDHGLPVVVSSALDSAVGIAAGLAAAAALPALPFDCGLATGSLLAQDVSAKPGPPVQGRLPVGAVAPEPGRLAALAAGPERTQWWRERLSRCHGVLAAREQVDAAAAAGSSA
jgi:O-succinylbenzoate synthase